MSKRRGDVKAEAARVAELVEQRGGVITCEQYVREASSPSSPLHPFLDWDSKRASHKYRLLQARARLRRIKYVVHTDTTSIRTVAYVHKPTLPAGVGGYMRLLDVRGDADEAGALLRVEFTRAGAMLRRARSLAVAVDMVDELDVVVEQIDRLHTRLGVKLVHLPQRPGGGNAAFMPS